MFGGAKWCRCLNSFVSVFWLFAWTAHNVRAKQEPQQRPVSVVDAIRMTKLGDPVYYAGGPSAGRVATFSPDGTKFVVVLRKGDLEHNTNQYSLMLWETAKLFHSAVPKVVLTMSSSSNREAITNISWLSDNETIAFLGEHPGELRQLYTFNIATQTLRRVTSQLTNVLSFSMTPKGDQVAYLAEKPVENLIDETARREGVLVTTQRLKDLVRGQKWARFDNNIGRNQLYILRSGAPRILAEVDGWGRNPPALSPNGKYVVVLNQVLQFPEDWKEYTDSYLHEWTRVRFDPGQYSAIQRYELIDTVTKETTVLLNSPSLFSSLTWLPDSGSVVIAGIYLPLEDTKGDERKARQSKTFTVEVKAPTREFGKITDEGFESPSWDSKRGRLVFEARGPDSRSESRVKVAFRRSENKWEKVTGEILSDNRPEIILQEDMTSPPKIFAVDSSTHKKTLLLDLNPQFTSLRFGRVEEVSWDASDGHEVRGGLYYPVDYVPGKKYPLVIQTHGWDARKFWIDGPYATAFAAQPLAAKGILVLQADENETDDFDTARELPREVSSLESAIDYLDKRAMIDPNRVGIIGFSRSGDIVSYALTHSKFHFAAASVADGGDQGFYTYMVLANTAASNELEFLNGGMPFGDGLKSWLKNSAEFSLERIQTPVRLLALGPDLLLSEWGWFAGSFRLGKAIEMIYLPGASHVLQKPWERMVSQQGNVDWFCFWLKDEEDSNPAKAEQYVRWREMRKLQEENEKKPAQEKSKLIPQSVN